MNKPVSATDVTPLSHVEKELRERLVLEQLVAELAARFVSADPNGLEAKIRESQAKLCEAFEFDACSIWQSRDDAADTLDQTHLFIRTQLPEPAPPMTASEYFPWVAEQLRATGKVLVIPDTSALPPEAASDAATYTRFGIRSALAVPSRGAEGTLHGVVSCVTLSPRSWTPEVISGLETLSRVMLIALDRERSDRRAAADREQLRLLNDRLAAELAERVRAAETLRVSEEKFRIAFMTGIDAIYLATLDEGRIIDCNGQFSEVFGYRREEALGKTSLGLNLYDEPSDRARMIAEIKAKGFVRDLEVWGRKKGGDRILVSLSVSILRIGAVPHILGFIRDITQRERARAEQAKLEEQLRQAQKMESIGRLSGGVAHDFNNLLSVISSYVGFALEGVPAEDPVRDDLLEVKKASERAAGLTRQLLAFSRKQLLEPVVLDINRVVRDVEKMLRRLLGEDISIVLRLSRDLGSVMMDPGQLEQLLMNLVVNARDAMPRGGRLTIETSNVGEIAGTGSQVMLAVSDTGCGIDAATRAQIFEPFFTTKALGKGTGLGLSTVFGIVKQSGGDIEVVSEPGQGATFKVTLPRVSAPAAESIRKLDFAPTSGKETVLIVEDEAAVRRIAERILRNAGYQVLSTESGGDAVKLCQQHEGALHLLLTDVVMPQMGGRELAEALIGQRPELKVLYMSGYTDDAIANHGTLIPGTHFIGKPFAATELTRKVREALDA